MVQDTKFIKTSTDNLFIKIIQKKGGDSPPFKISICSIVLI